MTLIIMHTHFSYLVATLNYVILCTDHEFVEIELLDFALITVCTYAAFCKSDHHFMVESSYAMLGFQRKEISEIKEVDKE